MRLNLTKPITRSSNTDPADVKSLKRALNALGYYVPLAQVGMSDMPDNGLFAALRLFQEENNIPATGEIRPGDETEKLINQQLSAINGAGYIWKTVGDDKVRGSHRKLNGAVKLWGDFPEPGEEFGCRCWAEPIPTPARQSPPTVEELIDEIPEPLFLIPQARGARTAISLLRSRALNSVFRDTRWTFGRHKSAIRWRNQMKKRGWTRPEITRTIKFGKKHKAPNKVNKQNTATRYQLDDKFVVRDDQTREILQISKKGFSPNTVP